MEQIRILKKREYEDTELERQKIGIRRDLIQIADTITFELKKNLKKLYVMLFVYFSLFMLSFAMNEFLWDLMGEFAPTNSATLMSNYIGGFFTMALLISCATFAGPIIAEDFYRQTGNLLFPKITKSKLLIGRLVSNYILNAICIVFFYTLVSIVAFIKYGEVSTTIFNSIGWALLYTMVLISFVTFLSSFMKNASFTIITSIFFVLIIMEMIPFILAYSGVLKNNETPMFFLFNYFGLIIGQSLAMPIERYGPLPQGGFGGGEEIKTWLTPNELGALLGMIIYILFFLSFAYIIYRSRQSKGE